MYLGLAHSVSGFFDPIADIFNPTALDAPDQAAELALVHAAIVFVGGLAWFSATYVGPAISLLRSPFGRPVTAALGGVYLALLVALMYVSTHALRLEAARAGVDATPPPTLLGEFLQPLRW